MKEKRYEGRSPSGRRFERAWSRSLLQSQLGKNAIYSLTGFLVPTLVLLAFTPLLVRQMGAASYGLWTIGLAALGLMGALELGFGTAIAKFVSEYTRHDETRALSATITIAFATYTLIGLGLTVPLLFEAHRLATFFDTDQIPTERVDRVLTLVALGLVPLLLKSGSVAVAVGLQRFDIAMTFSIFQNVVTVLAAVAVAYSGRSVEAVVLSSVCVLWAVAIASVAFGVRLLRRLGVTLLFTKGYTRKTLSYVAYASLSNIGSLVFSSVDRIAVGAILGFRAVAYYAVSIGVANRLLVVADLVTRPLMPASSSWFSADRPDVVLRYLKRATKGVALGSLAVCVVLVLLSKPFLRLWMGVSFADHAIGTFRVLIVIYAVIAVAAPGYHVANGIGHPGICAGLGIIGGAATIALIVVLGGAMGVIGAAWANAAYCVTLLIPVYAALTLSRSWSVARPP